MVNSFLINKQIKRSTSFSSIVKLYSFRKHTFNSYLRLFIHFCSLYLHKLYVILQSVRFFNIVSLLSLYSSISFTNSNLNFFSVLYPLCIVYYFNNLNLLLVHSEYQLLSKSHYMTLVKSLCFFFYNISLIFSLPLFFSKKLISLPNNTKLFTILRSPHTDKKSREQFNLVMSSKSFIDSLGFSFIFFKLIYSFSIFSLFIRVNTNFSYFN